MSSSETPTILSRPMWRRTVAAIIAVQAAMHIWVLTGRSFYWDDFIIVGGSVDNPWWSPSFWAQAHEATSLRCPSFSSGESTLLPHGSGGCPLS